MGLYNSRKDEISLNSNRITTIGRVTKIKKDRHAGSIRFEFYANGKLVQTKNPNKSGWPKYVRESKARRFEFYPVEYDYTNPENSKILITRKPLAIDKILREGIRIKGEVENAYETSNSYVDLYIKYTYLKNQFHFRTRQHKDSLPCKTVEKCKKSKIDLLISKDFPDINNLYYSSYDRKAMKKSKRLR
ncbi:MAG: hypothetical protein Mars2KO_23530 [Maribacter sp.]